METKHPLRVWRKSLDRPLTQTELAEQLGIGPSQISQIEAGQRGASLEVALKIQKLAGDAVPLDSLLPGSPQ
jgi:transcriptional regulator with XRE-family HTH domain